MSKKKITNNGDVIPAFRNKGTSAMPTLAIKTVNRQTFLDKQGTLTLNGASGQVTWTITEFSTKKDTISSPTQHQVLMLLLSDFTKKNKPGKTSLDPLCEFDLEQFLAYKGISREDKNDYYRERKKLKRDLDILAKSSIKWEPGKREKANDGDYIQMSFIGTHGIRRGKVFAVLDGFFANNLLDNNTITQYNLELLQLGSKEVVEYAIGCKLSEYWHIKRNQEHERHDKISIKSLLNSSTLPSMTDLLVQRNASKWQDRILDKFEDALERLCDIGLLNDYQYVKEDDSALTDAEDTKRQKDYNFFETLYLKFDLNGTDVRKKPQN